MSYLAIDPGAHSGWAFWRSAQELIACGSGDPRLLPGMVAKAVIIERPEIYGARFMKGDPNLLVTLAIGVGRYVEYYESRGARVALVLPKAWKGQIPKPIHHARLEASFSPHERATVAEGLKYVAKSHHHDVLDAVGLGIAAFQKTLWA